jgi:hypothetical protein
MPIPDTVNDQVAYAPRNIYATQNVLVDIDDDNRLDIYGDVYLNGSKIGGNNYVDIRQYGAKGDGIADDTAAIQTALNVGGTVYIPPGTYLLNGSRKGTFNALLTYTSNTHIVGDGDLSVLKVASNYTVAGDYRVFAPATATATNNVIFERFKIDGNAANNLVLGSSGGNVRQAYMIYCDSGTDFTVDDMSFVDHPGRNVLCLGNNTSPPSITNGRVTNCYFSNVGGLVPGNHLQNDHSSIYTQFNGGLVANNYLTCVETNPATPVSRTVTALEIHGTRTIVRDNKVSGYTLGGNAVASVHDNDGSAWTDNVFRTTGVGVNLWSIAPWTLSNFTFSHNKIYGVTAYNSYSYCLAEQTHTITNIIRNLVIDGNLIETDMVSTGVSNGLQLMAVYNGIVSNNIFRRIPGCAIQIDADSTDDLDIDNLRIEGNILDDCGTNLSRPWLLRINNGSTFGAQFRNIFIDRNTLTKPNSSGSMRGIVVSGAGRIEDLTFGSYNTFNNIPVATNLFSNTATNTLRLTTLPRIFSGLTATSPVSGVWLKGDQVMHTDVAASGTLGKVCTTAGGATEAVWAATTAYTVGQWIRLSGGQVMECLIAGTSGGTQPTVGVMGDPVVDGTVTWAYRVFGQAVFKTFGTVAP